MNNLNTYANPLANPMHVDPTMLNKIRQNAPWFYTLGIVLIILGTLALSSTIGLTITSVFFFGWLLAISGLVELIHSFWSRPLGNFFLNLLAGVFGIVVGGLMILNPTASALSLTLIFGVYFIVEGIVRSIIAAINRGPYWGWIFFNGIVTLLLGLLIVAQWPYSGLWVIGLFVGIDLLISGWSLIIMPLMAKKTIETHEIHASSTQRDLNP